MRNLFLVLIFAFYLQNCILHSVSIDEKFGMSSSKKEKVGNANSRPIPVKLIFGKTKEEKFNIVLNIYDHNTSLVSFIYCDDSLFIRDTRDIFNGMIKCNLGRYLKNNYFTDEFFVKIKKTDYFLLNAFSNLKIEINAYPGKEGGKGKLHSWGPYTWGITPISIYTYGKIIFDVYDVEKNQKLKSFNYNVEHTMYEGISPWLFGFLFPLFSERYEESLNHNTYSIARVAFNEFEEDFIKEFNTDEKLQKAAYLNNPPINKIQNPAKEEIAKNSYLPYLIAKLESKLLQRGVEIIKQDDSPKSPSPTKADQVIKVDSLNILKDSISISVSCLDVKNNSEAWVEKVNLSANADNTESTLDKAVDRLIDNLVSKGEIN